MFQPSPHTQIMKASNRPHSTNYMESLITVDRSMAVTMSAKCSIRPISAGTHATTPMSAALAVPRPPAALPMFFITQ